MQKLTDIVESHAQRIVGIRDEMHVLRENILVVETFKIDNSKDIDELKTKVANFQMMAAFRAKKSPETVKT